MQITFPSLTFSFIKVTPIVSALTNLLLTLSFAGALLSTLYSSRTFKSENGITTLESEAEERKGVLDYWDLSLEPYSFKSKVAYRNIGYFQNNLPFISQRYTHLFQNSENLENLPSFQDKPNPELPPKINPPLPPNPPVTDVNAFAAGKFEDLELTESALQANLMLVRRVLVKQGYTPLVQEPQKLQGLFSCQAKLNHELPPKTNPPLPPNPPVTEVNAQVSNELEEIEQSKIVFFTHLVPEREKELLNPKNLRVQTRKMITELRTTVVNSFRETQPLTPLTSTPQPLPVPTSQSMPQLILTFLPSPVSQPSPVPHLTIQPWYSYTRESNNPLLVLWLMKVAREGNNIPEAELPFRAAFIEVMLSSKFQAHINESWEEEDEEDIRQLRREFFDTFLEAIDWSQTPYQKLYLVPDSQDPHHVSMDAWNAAYDFPRSIGIAAYKKEDFPLH